MEWDSGDSTWNLHQDSDDSSDLISSVSGYDDQLTLTFEITTVDAETQEESTEIVIASRRRTDVEYAFMTGVNEGITLASVDKKSLWEQLDEIDVDSIQSIGEAKIAIKSIIAALKQI